MPAAAVMRWGAIALLAGCGPVVLAPESTASTTSGDVSSDPSVAVTTVGDAVTSESATTVGTIDPTTGAADTSTSGVDSVGFIMDPDGGGRPFECSQWEQDCPKGEKCMPWSNDGGGSWNATKCVPIAEDPQDVGEPCTVVESGVSGIDDCVEGAMCFYVDPETLMGECVALCQGSEANPFCENPCTNCVITSEGVFTPCLPNCDPLQQDCAEGQACYPVSDAFACAPDVSGEAGALGDECEFINVCDPGLACVNPELVPGCGGVSCCTAFCNADAEDECDAMLPGTSCVPWYEEGQRPQGCASGTVGICAVPQ